MALTHSDANWTQALADLREAAPKPRGAKSLRQAIEDAIDDIISCRERGHTDGDIVAIFARNGIRISLHTFRQYVRQARRVRAEQALEERGKAVRASKAQSRDIRSDAPRRSPAERPDAEAILAAVSEVRRVDTFVEPAAIFGSNATATPISQTVAKPPTQTGKTASEVLGHRFNEDV